MKEYWSWQDSALKIPEFAVFKIFNSLDLIKLDIKIKEEVSSREELSYSWNWPKFTEFYQNLKAYNEKIKKTDFKGKHILYSEGSELIQISFYFSKKNWDFFYNFIDQAYREFAEQRKVFQERFGRRL